jgi:hypothetical protein
VAGAEGVEQCGECAGGLRVPESFFCYTARRACGREIVDLNHDDPV